LELKVQRRAALHLAENLRDTGALAIGSTVDFP
jgi:hypothetical protein